MIVELLSCRAHARWCAEVLEVRQRAVEALGAVPALQMDRTSSVVTNFRGCMS